MNKFPFDNAGFLALQTQLYQWSDEALTRESEKIRADFDLWMAANFELSERQRAYLLSIDARAKLLLAFDTSFAIENKLPISLKVEGEPNGDDQGKIIWPKSSLTASSGGSIGYEAGGTLQINIKYETHN